MNRGCFEDLIKFDCQLLKFDDFVQFQVILVCIVLLLRWIWTDFGRFAASRRLNKINDGRGICIIYNL
jgi:hypothetical protein